MTREQRRPEPRSEQMDGVDHAWLQMESPTNLMVINAVLRFDEPLDLARLKRVLLHRLCRYDRFRQRVREGGLFAPPRWEYAPHFDLDAHVERVSLHVPQGAEVDGALQALIGQLMSTPLDRARPLWHATLVEHVGEGSAVILRIHHCIADGVALIKVLLSLTDSDPDTLPERPARRRARVPLLPSARARMATASPLELRKPAKAALAGAAASTASLGKLVLLPSDPKTPLKGPLGIEKRVAWSRSVELETAKRVAKAHGVTLNDLLANAVAGALRRYLAARGALSPFDLRAVMPVNLRSRSEHAELGNRFGLAFLPLPLGLGEPAARLREVHKRTTALKRSPQAAVVFGILKMLGHGGRQLEAAVINIFGKKGSLVFTNVPGPRENLYFAGKELSSLIYWVPQSGRLGLGISIFSFAGSLRFGVASDAGLIENPSELVEALHLELAAMLGEEATGERADTGRIAHRAPKHAANDGERRGGAQSA